MHPQILALTLTADATWASGHPNRFHGFDMRLANGELLRLYAEFADPDEGYALARFTGRGDILAWQVRFDANTPLSVALATLTEALN